MRSVHANAAIRAYLNAVGLPAPTDADLRKVREALLGAKAAGDPSNILSIQVQKDDSGADRALMEASYHALLNTGKAKS